MLMILFLIRKVNRKTAYTDYENKSFEPDVTDKEGMNVFSNYVINI